MSAYVWIVDLSPLVLRTSGDFGCNKPYILIRTGYHARRPIINQYDFFFPIYISEAKSGNLQLYRFKKGHRISMG